ncbi:MAG TPA: cobyrinate a,c-diamide synthase, partial [Candidatus Bathyarchaeia archaeon]|nr:cobyrinate a,c-diamide synthase [Candidatus Bathyarchaeia archaeon]
MRKGKADRCRGLVIAAPASGSGKTTVTLGLLAALRERGVVVQPLKAGPDFIDPGHHTAAAGGRRSRNLDGWMTDRDYVQALVARVTAGAEIALLEGMMGLFDGFDGRSGRGSTAELAAWLGWPVVLVIDAGAAARSVAAVVRGFRTFDPTVEIGGLIFNRVGGAAHLEMLADACAGEGVCVLGGLVFDSALEIRERHLGLHTATETRGRIDYRALGSAVASQIDLDRLQSLARPGTVARVAVEGR